VWWDLSQNSLQLSRPWVLKKGLTWDSMGAQVAVGYKDGAILVWDMVKGTCETVLKGHKGAITALAYNKSGALLASGSTDTNIIVWDAVGEAGLYSLRAHRDQVPS
jgi:U3 small nucleolar RNA-associated protein 12